MTATTVCGSLWHSSLANLAFVSYSIAAFLDWCLYCCLFLLQLCSSYCRSSYSALKRISYTRWASTVGWVISNGPSSSASLHYSTAPSPHSSTFMGDDKLWKTWRDMKHLMRSLLTFLWSKFSTILCILTICSGSSDQMLWSNWLNSNILVHLIRMML